MISKISTIRFTPDGFSLYDAAHNQVACDIAPGPDRHSHLQEAILEKFPVEQQSGKLHFEVETTRLLLLPPDIKSETLHQQMFDISLSSAAEEEQLLVQELTLPTGQEILLCFAISKSLYNFLVRNYEDISFSHPMATMLVEGARMAQGNCLVVRCNERYLELALFCNKQLQFCNSYHTTHAENRTYYVMNTWQQQELDQLNDYLLVIGGTNEGLQVRASAHRFIKHVFS